MADQPAPNQPAGEQPITTSIDDLVKYLNEHGETDSTTLSGSLRVSERIIETWSDVLEKAKIVKINYRLGKMFISPMVATKEGADVAKKTVELKKGVAEMELTTQIVMINQINTKLDEFKRYVAGAEVAFKSKAGQLKDMLDELEKVSQQIDSSYTKLKEKKDFVDQLAGKLDKEMGDLQERATKGMEISGNTEADSKRLLSETKMNLDNADNRIRTLNEEFNKSMESNRKTFEESLNGIRNEMRSLREIVSQQEKEQHEYAAFINSYKRESDSIKRNVAKERSRMMDEITRASGEVGKMYAVAEAQILGAKRTLEDIKSQFGGYADLSDKLNGIKNNIDSITRQKDEVQKELEELQEQLKALSALDDTKVAQKSMVMKRITDKVSKAGKKIEVLERDTDTVKRNIDDMAK